jgi:hypothetical protein
MKKDFSLVCFRRNWEAHKYENSCIVIITIIIIAIITIIIIIIIIIMLTLIFLRIITNFLPLYRPSYFVFCSFNYILYFYVLVLTL